LPNFAFLLIAGGILLIACEFVWVGKVWFGLAGVVCVLAGVAAFLRMPHGGPGLALILGAAACFAAEALFETFCLAGVLGSVLWAAGFWKLGVYPPLDVAVSAVLGGAITWLLSIAKRARQNKRAL